MLRGPAHFEKTPRREATVSELIAPFRTNNCARAERVLTAARRACESATRENRKHHPTVTGRDGVSNTRRNLRS